MPPIHKKFATGHWHSLSLIEQLANVGSHVARATRWYEKDQQRCDKAFDRALELLDLTIADERWKGRRKELTRVPELLCDALTPMAATSPLSTAISSTSHGHQNPLRRTSQSIILRPHFDLSVLKSTDIGTTGRINQLKVYSSPWQVV